MDNHENSSGISIFGKIIVGVFAVIGAAASVVQILEWFGISPKKDEEISGTAIIYQTAPTSETSLKKIESAELSDDSQTISEAELTEAPTEPPTTEAEHLSVYINDLDYLSSEGAVYNDGSDIKDNTGTQHRHSLYVDSMTFKACYVEYHLEEKYTDFTFTCGVSYYQRSASDTKYFEIMGDDGNILYTSPVMSAGSLPEEFTINVTGVNVLRIQYPKTYGSNSIATLYDGLLTS